MAIAKKRRSTSEISSWVLSVLLLASVLFAAPALAFSADEQPAAIDADYAENFASVLLQGRDGRIQPVDTAALALLKKVAGARSIFGLTHNQVFAGLVSQPEVWQKIPMIRVKHPKIKALLGIAQSDEYFAFNNIYEGNRYKLDTPVRHAQSKHKGARDTFDTELLSIEESLGLLYAAYSGESLKIFPLKSDRSNAWTTPSKAMKAFPKNERKTIVALLQDNFYGVREGLQSGEWKRANDAVEGIKAYQRKNAPSTVSAASKIELELLYNKYNIFEKLIGIYLILGVVLFGIVFAGLAKPSFDIFQAQKKPLLFLGLAFGAQTAALGMRWYISGHAPWSNSYETMIYISWTVMLTGLVFAMRSKVTAAAAAVFAALILYAASLSWLDPQMTQLPPILKSFWFTLHVSVITASYAFFGLCAVLGMLVLIFLMILQRLNDKQRADQLSRHIKEMMRIIEMSLIIAVTLITVGNFIGAAWANASWGRLWGWDPKESWTLVTILVYAAVIHMRFIPGLHTTYNFAVASVVSFASVLMTYFGVNYYLSGMHSYAAGDPLPVPVWVYYAVAIAAVMVIAAFGSRNAMRRAI